MNREEIAKKFEAKYHAANREVRRVGTRSTSGTYWVPRTECTIEDLDRSLERVSRAYDLWQRALAPAELKDSEPWLARSEAAWKRNRRLRLQQERQEKRQAAKESRKLRRVAKEHAEQAQKREKQRLGINHCLLMLPDQLQYNLGRRLREAIAIEGGLNRSRASVLISAVSGCDGWREQILDSLAQSGWLTRPEPETYLEPLLAAYKARDFQALESILTEMGEAGFSPDEIHRVKHEAVRRRKEELQNGQN